MRDPEKYQILKSYFLDAHTQGVSSNDLAFIRAVEDYSQLENKNTLSARARIIYRKYLEDRSTKRVVIDDETMDAVRLNMSGSLSGRGSSTFQAAQKDVLSRLSRVFREGFTTSDPYIAYWHHMRETN